MQKLHIYKRIETLKEPWLVAVHPYKLHPYRVTFTERERWNFIWYYSYKFDEFELGKQTAKLITCSLTSIFELTFELTG